ncbi:unnamed protein product [Didymodactylos carnosus]|nr:unnamed protein product [Didymodactylos carnosus]CAF3687618.1 unnamed protein product [Didymodactylos carnosus]
MYTKPGYTNSLGSALAIGKGQSVVVQAPPHLKLSDSSFTFEVWIYATNLSMTTDNAIVGQCQTNSQASKCFHLVIRKGRAYFGFMNDDLIGATLLSLNQWYHLAFIFHRTTREQIIYVNGMPDGFRTAQRVYQGQGGNITIGLSKIRSADVDYFNGYLDELSYVSRAKTDAEILTDATLVVWYEFEDNHRDSGPLHIDGTMSPFSFSTGVVGQAVLCTPSTSYFQATGFTMLGKSDYPFSITMWIKPTTSAPESTLVYITNQHDYSGVVPTYCAPFIGLSPTGQIVVQGSWSDPIVALTGPYIPEGEWTHVAETYSSTNGIRLYLNGTFIDTTGPFSYVGAGVPVTLTLSNPQQDCIISGSFSPFIHGPYHGMIDEFRLYSRELTSRDIHFLANPLSNPFITEIEWQFDQNTQDYYNIYNGFPVFNNNDNSSQLSYVSPGYTGYGSALNLTQEQAVIIPTPPYLNLSYSSFTFEVWLYPIQLSLERGQDNAILGQCQQQAQDKCLHLVIRQGRPYLGFLNDDLTGTTLLSLNRWYHLAFVFDHETRQQIIYVNGVNDGYRTASRAYQGVSGNLTIGVS